MVQLTVKIGKTRVFDNIFFGESQACIMLRMSKLQFQPAF